jgi:UDP:flavonoid glycosyltransferase YjiC (YdhE family)
LNNLLKLILGSPAFIPKPKEWGSHITVSGFYFLSSVASYTPDAELSAFLEAGPPPIYIGFGSIVVEDPHAMTEMIFDAVKRIGLRALVSKGWGGLGGDQIQKPDNVFMLGNVPHDWLFNHVSCVVHHGGAGTTSAGIAAGKPTVVVPFFGDQMYWGSMIHRKGAGPMPIPYKDLNGEMLANSIKQALEPGIIAQAQELGMQIHKENGNEVGAQSFNDQLQPDRLRCSLVLDRVAIWTSPDDEIKLSALAAAVLAQENLIDIKQWEL